MKKLIIGLVVGFIVGSLAMGVLKASSRTMDDCAGEILYTLQMIERNTRK